MRWWRKMTVAVAALVLGVAPAPGVAQELTEPDRMLTPRLEDVYTVGASDGAEWETFGEIRSAGFDAAGNLYILDPMNFRVTVVDHRGRHLSSFGTRGEGPGELRMPTALAVLPDGTTVVQDLLHRAYLVFGPGGDFQGSVPLTQDGAAMRSLSVSVGLLIPDLRGGAVYDAGTDVTIAPGRSDQRAGRPIRHLPVSGDGAHTVVHVPWRPSDRSDDQVSQRPDGTTAVRVGRRARIWEPTTHVAPLPDGGVAVIDSTTWKIDIIAPEGGVRTRLRRPSFVPIAVTERLARRERERRLRALEESGPGMRVEVGGRALPPEQLNRMARSRVEEATFYHEVPVLAGLRTSPTGLLWVQRTTPGDSTDTLIDLVRWDGTYLGSLRNIALPAAIGPDGLVAWVERGEFDVPRVVVKRMPLGMR